MRLLDLFSGIGGFSLGLERAGFETVAFCEISPVCRHLLAHHWPDVPAFDDITTLTGEMVGPIDAICGGFPCQDISFAGKGAGMAGERSGLWREYARLIGELRPRFVFVENVAALLGRGLGDVLGDLAALGYDAWWDCIPASAVGAPHRRDRLWVVAYRNADRFDEAAFRSVLAGAIADAGRVCVQGLPTWDDAEADALNPDADRVRPHRARIHIVGDAELRDEQVGLFEPMGLDVADATSERCGEARELRCKQPEERASRSRQVMADASVRRRDARAPSQAREHQGRVSARGRDGLDWRDWSTEPDVGRVAHGVPARVDRLHGLGNAVVPQIPEILGRAVLTAMAPQIAEAA